VSVGGGGPGRREGETIGKYRIVEAIGRGGMGMIFKAHDPILDRLVALKVILPEIEVSDDLRTRFFREAKACAKLNHPNIVTVHDMGEDAGRLFIVMEFLQGEELRQIIKANRPLTLEDKLSLIRQVCRGLHFAHQHGVVHRDMKPANIFVLPSGQVKILDFGIALLATTDPGLTRTGLIMGTLRYISPEQVRGRVDHRSDMFSLGSVLYELLTARPPFPGDNPMQVLEQLRSDDPPPPTQIDPTIPPELEAVVQRAMRKDPAERYRDMDEMGAALESVHARLIERRQAASVSDPEDQERQAAQRARELATQGRNQAVSIDVTQYAPALWAEAEARLAQAQAALGAQASSRAVPLFAEASSLYRQAEEATGEARERERRRAGAARERVGEARRSAEALDAEHRAASTWADAVARSDEAEAAWLRKQYPRAAERFEAALALYHRAQAEVRDAARSQREKVRAPDTEPAAAAAATPGEAATVLIPSKGLTQPPTEPADAPPPLEPAPASRRGSSKARIAVAVTLVAAAMVAGVVFWRWPAPTRPPDQPVAASPSQPPSTPASAAPVEPPPAPAPPTAIRQSVEDRLRGAGMLRGSNADESGVAVSDVGADGRISLIGVLKNRRARQAAVDLVRAVAGVTAVDVSRVTVKEGWVSQ
jgi:predicted Ser/Thr protein kinase